MNKLKKLGYILSWIPPALITLVLWLIGLFFIPSFLINTSQEKYKMRGRYFSKLWFLWDNKEEGCPDWWLRKAIHKNLLCSTFPRWWWFAVRNPVNGMRYIFKDREAKFEGWQGKSMEAADLIEAGVESATRWAYNGVFAGYRKVELNGDGTYNEFWVGWKVGSDVDGMGFTLQRRKNREIGQ